MGSSVAISEDLTMSNVSGAREDKIFVSIRLRPLSDKETAGHDLSDWECIDENTLIFNNSLPERSMYPFAYTFAIDLYTQAIELNSQNAVYWASSAFAHTKLEEYGSAIQDASKLLKLIQNTQKLITGEVHLIFPWKNSKMHLRMFNSCVGQMRTSAYHFNPLTIPL